MSSAISPFLSFFLPLPYCIATMVLKRTVGVVILVLGLHFVLHLRVSLLQQFTTDVGYLFLASLVVRSQSVHIFYSQ